MPCLIGKMGSLMNQVKLGSLHRRPIQKLLHIKWDQIKGDWEEVIALEEWLLPHLAWWLDRENTTKGVSLTPFKPEHTLYTDASQWGYGATMGDLQISQQWYPEEAKLHSNNREMLATIKAVEKFQTVIANSNLLICSDNATTVATINKQGGTKSWSLTDLAWKLWTKLDSLNCRAKARHIPGKLNVRADAMSRMNQILATEWSILQSVLIPLWELWGVPSVDLFATRDNHKLPRFVSPVPDSMAWKTNALIFCWSNLYAYAFPPWEILGEVLLKIKDDIAEVILIAPHWEGRPWFPLLLDLLVEPPIQLPIRQDLLIQAHSGRHCQNLKLLNLHAWRLSGRNQPIKDLVTR